MREFPIAAVTLLLASVAASAQAPAAPLHFQSASIKIAYTMPKGCNDPLMLGGPGTSNPTTVTFPAARPIDLLAATYGVRDTWIRGLDRWGFAWNGEVLYKIVATVPHGATRDQIAPMLQDLLEKRFHLVAQREAQATEVYELTVGAGDAKPQAAGSLSRRSHPHPGKMTLDPDGFPQLPPGCSGMGSGGRDGRMRIGARNVDLSDLTGTLSDLLGHPVLDKTDLRGKYDPYTQAIMDQFLGEQGGKG